MIYNFDAEIVWVILLNYAPVVPSLQLVGELVFNELIFKMKRNENENTNFPCCGIV